MAGKAPEIERVDFLAGEIHAIIGFILAAIEIHPARSLLSQEFEKSSQASLANMEMTLAGDKAIDGFQNVTAKFQTALRE